MAAAADGSLLERLPDLNWCKREHLGVRYDDHQI